MLKYKQDGRYRKTRAEETSWCKMVPANARGLASLPSISAGGNWQQVDGGARRAAAAAAPSAASAGPEYLHTGEFVRKGGRRPQPGPDHAQLPQPGQQTLHSTPYTLYNLYPTPCTLHSTL